MRDLPGRQARAALAEARVTGIDVSATGVRFTEALKRKHDIANLEVRWLPIERVAELGTTVRSDRLHRRPPSLAGPARGPDRAARCARAGRGHAPHGVRALRPHGHLHAAGVLPARRHPTPSSEEMPELVAALGALPAEHPLATAAARGAGLPEGGGARRCAAAPAGPRLFGAAALRAHAKLRPGVRPLGPAGALQPPLRRDGSAAAEAAPRTAARRRSNTPPSSCFAARCSVTAWSSAATTTRRAPASQLRAATRGSTTFRSGCPTRSS